MDNNSTRKSYALRSTEQNDSNTTTKRINYRDFERERLDSIFKLDVLTNPSRNVHQNEDDDRGLSKKPKISSSQENFLLQLGGLSNKNGNKKVVEEKEEPIYYEVIDDDDDEEEEEEEDEEEDNDAGQEWENNDNEEEESSIKCKICRAVYDNSKRFLIMCDSCSKWFHGDCVGLTKEQAKILKNTGESYNCQSCQMGPEEREKIKKLAALNRTLNRRGTNNTVKKPAVKEIAKPTSLNTKQAPAAVPPPPLPSVKQPNQQKSYCLPPVKPTNSTNTSIKNKDVEKRPVVISPRTVNSKKEAQNVHTPLIEQRKTQFQDVRLKTVNLLYTALKSRLIDAGNDPELAHVMDFNIKAIVNSIESEMYKEFGLCDKYTKKYRRLKYSIADSANTCFFKKILLKQYDPVYLVKMSSDEMASEELIEKREHETKEELKAIEEAQLLAAKTASLIKPIKITHKGEIIVGDESLSDLQDTIKTPTTTTASPIFAKQISVQSPTATTSPNALFNKLVDNTVSDNQSADVVIKDTTDEHDIGHDWDLNCKICINEDINSKGVKSSSNSPELNKSPVNPDLVPQSPKNEQPSYPSGIVDSIDFNKIHDNSSYQTNELWRGHITVSNIGHFYVRAIFANPLDSNKKFSLSSTLHEVGQTPRDKVLAYVNEIKNLPKYEITVLALESLAAASTHDSIAGDAFGKYFEYLTTRSNIGVVRLHNNSDNIKNFYLMPLKSTADVPQSILTIQNSNVSFLLAKRSKNILLALVITQHNTKTEMKKIQIDEANKVNTASSTSTSSISKSTPLVPTPTPSLAPTTPALTPTPEIRDPRLMARLKKPDEPMKPIPDSTPAANTVNPESPPLTNITVAETSSTNTTNENKQLFGPYISDKSKMLYKQVSYKEPKTAFESYISLMKSETTNLSLNNPDWNINKDFFDSKK